MNTTASGWASGYVGGIPMSLAEKLAFVAEATRRFAESQAEHSEPKRSYKRREPTGRPKAKRIDQIEALKRAADRYGWLDRLIIGHNVVSNESTEVRQLLRHINRLGVSIAIDGHKRVVLWTGQDEVPAAAAQLAFYFERSIRAHFAARLICACSRYPRKAIFARSSRLTVVCFHCRRTLYKSSKRSVLDPLSAPRSSRRVATEVQLGRSC